MALSRRLSLFSSRLALRTVALGLIALMLFPLTPVSAHSAGESLDQALGTLRSFWSRFSRPPVALQQGEGQSPAERASAVRELRLCPQELYLYAGETRTLVPLPLGADEKAVQGAGMSWSTGDSSVAKVSSWGEVAALAPGKTTVTVQAGAETAQVRLYVTAGRRPRQTDAEWDAEHAEECGGERRGMVPTVPRDSSAGTTPLKSLVRRASLRVAPGSHPPMRRVALAEEGGIDPIDGGGEDPFLAAAAAPPNATGTPRFSPVTDSAGSATRTKNNLGNSNFVFAAPVLGLGGRGIGVNLALIYNSRLWSKDSAINKMSFNYTKGWPAAGWSLGYGRLIENYDGRRPAGSDGSGDGFTNDPGDFLLIQPDGTRIVLKKEYDPVTAKWKLRSADGSAIVYEAIVTLPANSYNLISMGALRFPDGTLMKFERTNNRLLPSSIRSTNGDLLTIGYRTYKKTPDPNDPTNFPYRWAINSISDTLGRIIQFKYYGDPEYPVDALNGQPQAALAAVTAPDLALNSERVLVRLQYQNIMLQYNFSSFLGFVEGTPANNSVLTVVRRISYPATGRGFLFLDYSSYGMARYISVRNQMNGADGSVTDGAETGSTKYDYPSLNNQVGALDDAPQYTTRSEWWKDKTTDQGQSTMDASVYQYVRQVNAVNPPTRSLSETLPSGLRVETITDDSIESNTYGMVIETRLWNGATMVGRTVLEYEFPGGAPQLAKVRVTNDTGQTSQTEFDYGTAGQLLEQREYGFTNAVQRQTVYSYLDSAAYRQANLVRLPTGVSVYSGNTLKAKTTFGYDAYGVSGPVSYNQMVPHHDEGFGPLNTVRGNVTNTTVWVSFAGNGEMISRNSKYDIYGNVVEADVSCCQVQTVQFEPVPGQGSPTFFSQPAAVISGRDGQAPFLKTSYQYNFNTGLVTQVTNPDGNSSSVSYDGAWRPTQTTGITGAVTQSNFDKDPAGIDLLSTFQQVTYLDGTSKTITSRSWLNGAGMVMRSGTGAGASPAGYDLTAITYDALKRPKRLSNPYSGDANGNGTPQHWTVSTYDVLARVTLATLPDGQTLQTAFMASAEGLPLVKVTDQVGRQRTSETDGLGRLVRVREADPQSGQPNWVTTYDYDTLNNLTLVNQGGQTRKYTYDALSRVKTETTPEAGTIEYSYTDFGAVSKRKDARLVETNYGYDTLNRLVTIDYPETGLPVGVAPTADVTLTYRSSGPGNGELNSVTQGTWSETYGYDSLGRVTGRNQLIDGKPYNLAYQYNQANQLTTVTYPSGKQVRETFDARGRMGAISKLGNPNVDYVSGITYNPASQMTGLTLGNGVVENFGYSDQRLQLTSQQAVKGATTLMSLTYNYAAAGGASGANTTAGNSGQLMGVTGTIDGRNRDQAFTYDTVGRLVTATGWGTWGRRYEYDRWGNRTGVRNAVTNGTLIQNLQVQTATFPETGQTVATNRVATLNGAPQTYDQAGNLTANNPTQTMQYDVENRFVALKVAATGANMADYGFDAANQRIRKTVGTSVTHYIYDGGRVIAEYDGTSGALLTEYVYAGNRMIAREEGTTIRYYHQDRLSTRMLTDESGKVTGSTDSLPFGTEAQQCGENVKHAFTTYERDGESGTDYAMHRQFTPAAGRYNRPDPIGGSMGNPQSFNRYAYVNNDPVNLVDPLGLCTFNLGITVNNNALSTNQLTAFRNEIERIFGAAGHQVVFGPQGDYFITIVPNSSKYSQIKDSPDAVGFTNHVGPNVRRNGYVFVDRLKNAVARANEAETIRAFNQNSNALAVGLARATVHEIGHWLLQQAYDSKLIPGIMHSSFSGGQWFKTDQNTLNLFYFTPLQQAFIRARCRDTIQISNSPLMTELTSRVVGNSGRYGYPSWWYSLWAFVDEVNSIPVGGEQVDITYIWE